MSVVRKPKGGLWTSTYCSEIGSAWVQWCLGEDFGVPGGGWRSWLLEPDPAARVLEIDSHADLHRVSASYGLPIEYPGPLSALDFERLAVDYDAIHLTEAGQWATRLTHPLSLYGWDCESVLWLRWAFVGEPHGLGRRTWLSRE